MVLLYGGAFVPPPQFPNASTTGVPSGLSLVTVGPSPAVSSGPGWVLQGSGSSAFVKITGQSGGVLTTFSGFYVPYNVTVRANNVLIQNCLVIAPPNLDGIDVANISGSNAHPPVVPSTNVTIDRCTVTSQNPVSAQPIAFTATSGNPCVFTAPGTSFVAGNQVALSAPAGTTLPPGFADVGFYTFTASTSTSTFTAPGIPALISGQPIIIDSVSGTTFPGGFTSGTVYYVCNPGIHGTSTFQLSATASPLTPITVTGSGSLGGRVRATWYYVYSVNPDKSFTLALSSLPGTPLASGGTGTGAVQQLNTAYCGSAGIKDVNGSTLGLTITSCDVSNCTSCCQIEQGLVQANYFHDMNYAFAPGPGASHINGFSCGGNTTTGETVAQQLLTIKGNTSLNPWTQSDAIALFQDAARQMHKVVDGNLVAGAGFAMGCGFGGALASPQPVPTDIQIINNRFSTMYYPLSGQFGPADGWTAAMALDPSNIWSNNAYYESGATIPEPNA